MITLYLAGSLSSFKNMGKEGKELNCKLPDSRYFTAYGLKEKVAENKELFRTEKIEFDDSRSAKKVYKKCEEQGYVSICNACGETYYAIEEKGKQYCQTTLKELIQLIPHEQRLKLREIITPIQKPENFLTFEEYINRSDIKPILKYNKFTGRKKELEDLDNFLKDPEKKIIGIIGSSGSGKTRLVLEFVNQIITLKPKLDYQYDIYFVDPNLQFNQTSFNKRTLLILDDASRYEYLHKLINFVLNSKSATTVKLLLIDKSRDSIKYHTDLLFYSPPKFIEIKEGDIINFLMENFSWTETNVAANIQGLSKGNFYIAILYAYFFKERKILGEPKIILDWWISKNIDLHNKYNYDRTEVKFLLHLISIVMPLDWNKDKQYLEILPPKMRDTLENIIHGISIGYEESPFLHKNGYNIEIRPDLVADFLRLELIVNQNKMITELIRYMPYRVARNVKELLSIFYEESKDKALEVFDNIWNLMNTEIGLNREYVFALLYFVGNLAYFGFITQPRLTRPNPNLWLQSFENIYDQNRNEGLEGVIAGAIYNLANLYGIKGLLEQMDNSLNLLVQHYNKYPQIEVMIYLAFGFANACNHYARIGQLQKVNYYFKELEGIYQEHYEEMRRAMALCLVNVCLCFIIRYKPKEMEEYFEKLRKLYLKYKDKDIEQRVILGLYNAIKYYRDSGQINKIEYYLSELKVMTDKFITQFFSKSIAILDDDEYNQIMMIECAKAVDYDMSISDKVEMFIEDYALPQGHSPNTEVELKNFVIRDHFFLKVKTKMKDISSKEYNVIMCPFAHGMYYQQIIEYILNRNSNTDTKAEIVLTNRSTVKIFRDLSLSQEERENKMLRFGAMYEITLDLSTLLLIDFYNRIMSGTINKSPYCPYCNSS